MISQMTIQWLQTPVHELDDNTLMLLKYDLLEKVCEITNELTDRTEDCATLARAS